MTIQELFVEIGFKFDTMKLKDLGRAMADLNLSSIATALGIGTLFDATSKIMDIADRTATSIFGVSQVTGLTQKSIQQFSGAIQAMGGNAEDAKTSLKALQMSILAAQFGDAKPGFIFAKIDPFTASKDIFGTMKKIQAFLKDPATWTDPIKRMAIADFGLSESMIVALKDSQNLDEAMRDASVNVEAQTKALIENNKAWGRLHHDWQVVAVDVGARLAVVFREMAIWFDDFLRFAHHSPEFQKALGAIATGLLAIASAITLIKLGAIILAWLTGFVEIAAVIGIIVAGITFIAAHWDKLKEIREREKARIEKGQHEDAMFFSTMGKHALAAATTVGGAVTNAIDIVIHGATDPVRVGEEVGKKLQKMLTDRYYHQKTQER